jgi:hypothetical protein
VELLPERPESLSALSREEVNLHHVLGTGEGRWDLPQAVPTRLISLNLVETHGFSGSGSSGFQKPWWCVSGIPNYGPPKYPVCRCPIFSRAIFKSPLHLDETKNNSGGIQFFPPWTNHDKRGLGYPKIEKNQENELKNMVLLAVYWYIKYYI